MSSTAGAGAQPALETTEAMLTKQKVLVGVREVRGEGEGEGPEKGEPEDGEEDEEEEEDDEEDEEGEDEEVEGDAATRWQDSLDRIRTTLFSKTYTKEIGANEDRRLEFLREFKAVFAAKPPNEKANVLHTLAWNRTQRTWLLKHLLEFHKERMEDVSEGKRPLTLAISNKNEGFIKTILRSKHVRRGLVNLLGAKREDMENGIHLAIKTGLSAELTVELISKVTDEVLSRRDAAGLTPLHLAVEYERCTEAQLDVVKALLKHGDSALDVRTKLANLSVYRHHFSTRPKERDTGPAGSTSSGASTQRATGRRMRPAASDLPQAPPQRPSEGQTHGSEKGLDKKKLNQAKDGSGNQGDGELNDRGQAPTPAPGAGPRLPHYPALAGGGTGTAPTVGDGQDAGSRQQLANVARRVAPQPPGSSEGHTPKLLLVRRSTAKQGQGPNDGAIVTKDSADEIAKELKLHYLRSTFGERAKGKERTQEKAIEFLYGGSRNSRLPVLFVQVLKLC